MVNEHLFSESRLDDIIAELEADGFTKLDSDEDISEYTGKVFQVDTHCTDLLIFPPDLDLYFKDVHWVRIGQLVQQVSPTSVLTFWVFIV